MYQIFSPNMLKTYETCPKKFYFRYVKNLSMPVNEEIFEEGKNIHALASYYLKNENLSKMEEMLSSREKELWYYLKNLEFMSYQVINTEYNLSVRIGECFFGGRLDALVKKDDKYYILDYKTGSAPKNAVYDYQTMIYLLAVAKFFETDKVAFIYLDLKNKKEVIIELTKELITEYELKLQEVITKILASEFNKKYKNCNCEYNIICY